MSVSDDQIHDLGDELSSRSGQILHSPAHTG